MRKVTVSLLLFFLLVMLVSCPGRSEKIDQERTRILLVHPSLKRLTSFIYLIEQKIIDIPRLEMTAVFYGRADSEFDEINDFLQQNRYPYIHLKKITGDLNRDDLYQENSCSSTFYDLFRKSDGIIFLGGDDLQPETYERKMSLLTEIENPYRHFFELSFLFHLLGGGQNESFKPYLEERPEYIIYAFCLGLQTMNVATGGTLYQDIPHEIYGVGHVEDVLNLENDQQHRNYWHALMPLDEIDEYHFHRISFAEEGFFVRELGARLDEHPLVCSGHHQAIQDLGKGIEIAAISLDGKIVEAITHRKYRNVLGTQFHPELSELYDPAAKKYKRAAKHTELLSKHDVVKRDGSIDFHERFWKHFNALWIKK